MYEATVCILQAVAFFAISLYKRLADFLLAGEASGFGRDILLVSGVHDPVLSGATNRFLSENRKPIDRIS